MSIGGLGWVGDMLACKGRWQLAQDQRRKRKPADVKALRTMEMFLLMTLSLMSMKECSLSLADVDATGGTSTGGEEGI
jgi:hypothetical protein